MHVGVFDSGVGGLSILGSIRSALPSVRLSYCCDNLNFPYGTKSDDQVVRFTVDVTSRFFAEAKFDVLVIACNTASTIALAAVRAALPIPVVGVVPAVKPAAAASRSKVIGVLATPGTIRRPYLADLIREFAADCEVITCGSSGLVQLAERKLRGDIGTDDEFKREIGEIITGCGKGLDQLVLGCTHFPLVADELRRVLPPGVLFVDSGGAVASRVAAIGRELNMPEKSAGNIISPEITGYCSAEPFELTVTGIDLGTAAKLRLRRLP
jgi:glutamate racemase